MKKITRFFSTLFGSLIALFTGCSEVNQQYVLYMGPPPEFGGTVTDATTDDPIADLRVELLLNDEQVGLTNTGTDGTFHISLAGKSTQTNYTIKITDVDGTANGEYKGLTNTVYVTYSFDTNYKMEQK